MTVREALAEGRKRLTGRGTETPDLDAAVLFAHCWGIDRAKLYVRLPESAPEGVIEPYRTALRRRLDGEPVAWIIGTKEFWGLPFQVGPGVLCPRPDTETLVEAALSEMDRIGPSGTLHDVCTGPGTVALSLAAERPRWKISGSDISTESEKYYRLNAVAFNGGRTPFIRSDLMEGVDGPFDIVVANPPYLTPGETAERTALGWREPVLALDGGGDDGLELIRRLIPRIFTRLSPGGTLLMEADPLQMPILKQILAGIGFENLRIVRDLASRERVIAGGRPA